MAKSNETSIIDDDPSIPFVTTTTAPVKSLCCQHPSDVRISIVRDDGSMYDGVIQSDFLYDSSTSEEDGEDKYMILETESTINIASSSSSSSSHHNFTNHIQNSLANLTHQDQQMLRSMKKSNGYRWCYRPPFHVTAMYLWTQFNISYLLRKFAFLFDAHSNNENDHYDMDVNSHPHHYFHLVTIHYVETGIIDIIIMNLIIALFLSTSYVYRSRQGKSSHQLPTTTTTTASQRLFQSRQRSYQSKSYLLELVTVVTFLLLILRLRGAAINVILICTICMFLHLISRLFQFTLPSSLLFPYKL